MNQSNVQSAQEIFDLIVAHAEAMTEPSVDEFGSCVYRNSKGNKCLVGGLLTDEEYTEHQKYIEGGNAMRVCGVVPRLSSHVGLLMDCQNKHDKAIQHVYWKEFMLSGLESVAKEYGLLYNGKSLRVN